MTPLLQHNDFPHGILLVHKPYGLSSHTVVQRIRKQFNTRLVGHTGTLDPMATGMLPIVIGEATRFASRILQNSKAYRATIQLGSQTTTDDALGETLYTASVPCLNRQTLETALSAFSGTITQTVPHYSALKSNGQSFYQRARRGESFTPPTRSAHIEDITLLAYDPLQATLDVEITVGSGTYIRSIARDLGINLGCFAHLSALERLWVAPYKNSVSIALERIAYSEELKTAWIPLSNILAEYPRVDVDTSTALLLGHGGTAHIAATVPDGIIRTHYNNQLLGLCTLQSGLVTVLRLRSFPVPWIHKTIIQ